MRRASLCSKLTNSRYYIFPNVCTFFQMYVCGGDRIHAIGLKVADCKQLEQHNSTSNVRIFYINRQVWYKWRYICRNGSVITCNLYMQILVIVMENNFRNGYIRWQVSKHVKAESHILQDLPVITTHTSRSVHLCQFSPFQRYKHLTFLLSKLGHGHEVQNSQ